MARVRCTPEPHIHSRLVARQPKSGAVRAEQPVHALPWDYLHPNHGYNTMGIAIDIAPFAPRDTISSGDQSAGKDTSLPPMALLTVIRARVASRAP